MPATPVSVARAAIPRDTPWSRASRALLQALARTVDRLAPCRPRGRYAELPPTWFRYPPF